MLLPKSAIPPLEGNGQLFFLPANDIIYLLLIFFRVIFEYDGASSIVKVGETGGGEIF